MIWTFGSLHIDPAEIPELKDMLSKINRKSTTVAIELEHNKETLKALKRFRDLSDEEINKVLEYQFGKRKTIASFNFMKLIAKYENIEEVVSIEPVPGKRISELSHKAGEAYKELNSYIERLASEQVESDSAERLLKLYFGAEQNAVKQSIFREKNMARVVSTLARTNPKSDILLYCSEYHSEYVKAHLADMGIAFNSRENKAMIALENEARKEKAVLSKKYGLLSVSERLFLARGALFYYAVWIDPKDLRIERYYDIGKEVNRKIKSSEDYEKAVSNIGRFKRWVIA